MNRFFEKDPARVELEKPSVRCHGYYQFIQPSVIRRKRSVISSHTNESNKEMAQMQQMKK
jgi:hypothetical protein